MTLHIIWTKYKLVSVSCNYKQKRKNLITRANLYDPSIHRSAYTLSYNIVWLYLCFLSLTSYDKSKNLLPLICTNSTCSAFDSAMCIIATIKCPGGFDNERGNNSSSLGKQHSLYKLSGTDCFGPTQLLGSRVSISERIAFPHSRLSLSLALQFALFIKNVKRFRCSWCINKLYLTNYIYIIFLIVFLDNTIIIIYTYLAHDNIRILSKLPL